MEFPSSQKRQFLTIDICTGILEPKLNEYQYVLFIERSRSRKEWPEFRTQVKKHKIEWKERQNRIYTDKEMKQVYKDHEKMFKKDGYVTLGELVWFWNTHLKAGSRTAEKEKEIVKAVSESLIKVINYANTSNDKSRKKLIIKCFGEDKVDAKTAIYKNLQAIFEVLQEETRIDCFQRVSLLIETEEDLQDIPEVLKIMPSFKKNFETTHDLSNVYELLFPTKPKKTKGVIERSISSIKNVFSKKGPQKRELEGVKQPGRSKRSRTVDSSGSASPSLKSMSSLTLRTLDLSHLPQSGIRRKIDVVEDMEIDDTANDPRPNQATFDENQWKRTISIRFSPRPPKDCSLKLTDVVRIERNDDEQRSTWEDLNDYSEAIWDKKNARIEHGIDNEINYTFNGEYETYWISHLCSGKTKDNIAKEKLVFKSLDDALKIVKENIQNHAESSKRHRNLMVYVFGETEKVREEDKKLLDPIKAVTLTLLRVLNFMENEENFEMFDTVTLLVANKKQMKVARDLPVGIRLELLELNAIHPMIERIPKHFLVGKHNWKKSTTNVKRSKSPIQKKSITAVKSEQHSALNSTSDIEIDRVSYNIKNERQNRGRMTDIQKAERSKARRVSESEHQLMLYEKRYPFIEYKDATGRLYKQRLYMGEDNYLGPFDVKCKFCDALHHRNAKSATECCKSGRVLIPELRAPFNSLYKLISGQYGSSSYNYKSHELLYNTQFAMASLERTQAKLPRYGEQPVKLRGQTRTQLSAARARSKGHEGYANFYVFDPKDAAQMRIDNMNKWQTINNLKEFRIDNNLMFHLSSRFYDLNVFVRHFKMIGNIMRQMENDNQHIDFLKLIVVDRYNIEKGTTDAHSGCFNVNRLEDTVTVCFSTNEEGIRKFGDFTVYPLKGGFRNVSEDLYKHGVFFKTQLKMNENPQPLPYWVSIAPSLAYPFIFCWGEILHDRKMFLRFPKGTILSKSLPEYRQSPDDITKIDFSVEQNYPEDETRPKTLSQRKPLQEVAERWSEGRLWTGQAPTAMEIDDEEDISSHGSSNIVLENEGEENIRRRSTIDPNLDSEPETSDDENEVKHESYDNIDTINDELHGVMEMGEMGGEHFIRTFEDDGRGNIIPKHVLDWNDRSALPGIREEDENRVQPSEGIELKKEHYLEIDKQLSDFSDSDDEDDSNLLHPRLHSYELQDNKDDGTTSVDLEALNEELGRQTLNEPDEIDDPMEGTSSQHPETIKHGPHEGPRNFCSLQEVVAFRSHIRPWNKQFHPIYSFGKIGQTFLIDQCTRIMESRLDFERQRQKEMLVTTKQKLKRALTRAASRINRTVGCMFNVPSTIQGSPAFYRKELEKSIHVMDKYGHPDLFITFTGNKDWPEIQKNLLPGQKYTDVPFLVVKVFKEKFEAFLDKILGKLTRSHGKSERKGGIFGEVLSYCYSIEFQQRGMPHAHLLLTLKNKLDTARKIDDLISGELPPDTTHMEDGPVKERLDLLTERIRKIHMHSNCESRTDGCREGCKPFWKQCKKHFPKDFQDETTLAEDGYALLKRDRSNPENRWVVAHCPSLLLEFNCHINVEICMNVYCIRYIFKYIFKGFDRLLLEVVEAMQAGDYRKMRDITMSGHILHPAGLNLSQGTKDRLNEDARKVLSDLHLNIKDDNGKHTLIYDELRLFMETRAMTAMEAVWHLLGYRLTGSSHVVDLMTVHEENEENIFYEINKDPTELQEQLKTMKPSKLKAFFNLMQQYESDEEFKNLRFIDAPRFFTFDKKNGKWIRRKYHKEEKTIGAIRAVRPMFLEHFALRLLTINVGGAKSHADYKGGKATYVERARELRLMNDEKEWHLAMREAVGQCDPRELRLLFCQILVFGHPKDPPALWRAFEKEMMDRRGKEQFKKYRALYHIHTYLVLHNMDLKDVLPEFDIEEIKRKAKDSVFFDGVVDNEAVEIKFSTEESQKEVTEAVPRLTPDQKIAYDQIWHSISRKNNKGFCLLGSGGSGKTFLYKLIYHRLNADGKQVAMVAHTGIAATLLVNGQTVHRRFGVPLKLSDTCNCGIELNSRYAQKLAKLDVIIWDEASMSDRRVFECIDRWFRLVRNLHYPGHHYDEIPFGGVTVLCGGDFKQLLPIVDDVDSMAGNKTFCLKESYLWKDYFIKIKLKTNKRAETDPAFCQFLEDVGTGRTTDDRDQIAFPDELNVVEDEDKVIEEIFGKNILQSPKDLQNRCILTIRNQDAQEFNEKILQKYHKAVPKNEIRDLLAIDEPTNSKGFMRMPAEAYHRELPSGLPPYNLRLTAGAIVILLRNLDVRRGLCNGTRLRVCWIGESIVMCERLTPKAGVDSRVPICRIPLTPKESKKRPEWMFTRTQYPLRLAYAMTINKSQGQTLDKVGILLKTPIFSHGHLYVALSRVRHMKDIIISLYKEKEERDGKKCYVTRNVVLKDIVSDKY